MDVRDASIQRNSAVKGSPGSLKKHGFQNVMLVFAIPDVDMQVHACAHGKCSEKLLAKPDSENGPGT